MQTRRRSRTSPTPQDTKEIIQSEHIDHEQVDEKQQAVLRAKFRENLAKQNAESKKRSTMRETSAAEEQQNHAESILENQTEVEVEFHIEEEKAAEIKNQGSNGEDFTATTSNHSVEGGNRSAETVSKAQELMRTQREDGKQDAWNGHAQEASQAKAVPE